MRAVIGSFSLLVAATLAIVTPCGAQAGLAIQVGGSR
jgi:hypothetical protein